MSQGEVMAVMGEAMLTALRLSAPLLIVSIAVGLVVAVFQAATQIQEQTLTFVPKVLSVAILLFALGSWMITVLSNFTAYIFRLASTF